LCWRDAPSRARRLQGQPRGGSPSAWSRCLRSATRSIVAPEIRRSCKRHCLIPRVRTGRASSLRRRAGQRGARRWDRRLLAPSGCRVLHRLANPRAALQPPPFWHRRRVPRSTVPGGSLATQVCRPPGRTPGKLEHRPPSRHSRCLRKDPEWPSPRRVHCLVSDLHRPRRPGRLCRRVRCRRSRSREPSARRAPLSRTPRLRPPRRSGRPSPHRFPPRRPGLLMVRLPWPTSSWGQTPI
jgi:hypothetical protein